MKFIKNFVVGCTLLLSLATTAQTLDYPIRSIRLIVPFVAGGPVDVIARELSRGLQVELGQPVVVVNVGGGHGIPALNQVAAAPADGYTLYLPASGSITVPEKAMEGRDVLKELAPITQLTQSPHVLVVSSRLPVKTVQELIAYSKANPGQVNFAGTGGIAQLAMEFFRSEAQVNIVHVPYKGTAQVLLDLASGQVQGLFSSMPSMKPMIDKELIRPLGMTAPSKGEITARLPVISEQGLPRFSYTTWYGLFTKAGTPAAVIDRLNKAVTKVVTNPELNQKFEAQGVEFVTGTPAALASLVHSDQNKWKKIVQEAGIRLD
jgi:tripartite-type tricarboxylate transporter receptor subunit TctC